MSFIGYSNRKRPIIVNGSSWRSRERLWKMGCSVDVIPQQMAKEIRAFWRDRYTGEVVRTVDAADLRSADLRNADLRSADMSGANLGKKMTIISVSGIGSARRMTTYWIEQDRVFCGCFTGTEGE